MSQAPSMPMYWDAYLADTTHLTTEEHGAYLLLLGAMWRRNGTVPDDDRDNARILGLTKAKWIKTKSRLSGALIFENDCITQKKLQKTWQKTQETIQKNRVNGAKGGRPKYNKNNKLAKPNGLDLVIPNETIPIPIPLPKEKENYIKEFEAFWADYGRCGNKKTAKDKFTKVRSTISLNILQEANKKYIKHLEVETWKKKKDLTTWLNKECWDDDYSIPKPKSKLSENLSDWTDEIEQQGNLI